MRFAKVKATCLGCRAPIKEPAAAPGAASKGGGKAGVQALSAGLCDHCAPRVGELYAKQLCTVNELEGAFGEMEGA